MQNDDEDLCPDCGAELDADGVCPDCGYDSSDDDDED